MRVVAALAVCAQMFFVAPPAEALYKPEGMQWFQQASEPVRVHPPLVQPTTRLTAPFSILPALPLWQPEHPDQIARRRPLAAWASAFFWNSETPTAAFDPATGFPWPQPQVPVRRGVLTTSPATAEPVEPPAAAPEEITLDKWWRPASEPTRRLERPTEGQTVSPVRSTFPEARLDWLAEHPDLRRPPIKPAVAEGQRVAPVRATFPEARLDWFSQQQPRPPRLWSLDAAGTAPVFVEPPAPFDPASFPFVDAGPGVRSAPRLAYLVPSGGWTSQVFTVFIIAAFTKEQVSVPIFAVELVGVPQWANESADAPRFVNETVQVST